MLTTARMRLVPGNAALARAEIHDRAEFARLLGARVPESWPPALLEHALPFFLSRLEADPDLEGWMSWYGVLRNPDGDVLALSGGYVGPPASGTVEIGYSALPEFQGQGLATEMMRALVDRALESPGVLRVIADVHPGNLPSERLLAKLGFEAIGDGAEPGTVRYHLVR